MGAPVQREGLTNSTECLLGPNQRKFQLLHSLQRKKKSARKIALLVISVPKWEEKKIKQEFGHNEVVTFLYRTRP